MSDSKNNSISFEYREVNGERVFGSANGAILRHITVLEIGSGHVLIALVIFQDDSWVKMNFTCKPLCTVSCIVYFLP